MTDKTTTRYTEAQIRDKFVELGIDLNDPDLIDDLNESMEAARARVTPPAKPSDTLTEAQRDRARRLQGTGRVMVMMQVIINQALAPSVILIALIILDIWRMTHAVSQLQPGFMSFLIAVGFVVGYLYVSFTRAELSWRRRDQELEMWSLRRVWQSLSYTLGLGANWQPKTRGYIDSEYRRANRLWQVTLAVMAFVLLAEFGVPLWADIRAGRDVVEGAVYGIGLSLLTLVLLLMLELAIRRTYAAFMAVDGAELEVSADFLIADQARYAKELAKEIKQARLVILRQWIMRAQEMEAARMIDTGNGSTPKMLSE